MRSPAKLLLVSSSIIVVAGGLLFAGGCLSTPRDYASPLTTIKVVDQNGAPISGVEVERHWYDSDCGTHGDDKLVTDQTGVAQFPKAHANVGLFTGVLRKTIGNLGSCGVGSGTSTTIYVGYVGRYEVVPKDKPLHSAGMTQQDADGVWFDVSTDSLSNTLVNLSFPKETEVIDYILSSKCLGEK